MKGIQRKRFCFNNNLFFYFCSAQNKNKEFSPEISKSSQKDIFYLFNNSIKLFGNDKWTIFYSISTLWWYLNNCADSTFLDDWKKMQFIKNIWILQKQNNVNFDSVKELSRNLIYLCWEQINDINSFEI